MQNLRIFPAAASEEWARDPDETNIRAMQAPSSSRPQFTAVEERELSTVKANESLFLNYVARFEAAMRSCKQEDDQRSN